MPMSQTSKRKKAKVDLKKLVALGLSLAYVGSSQAVGLDRGTNPKEVALVEVVSYPENNHQKSIETSLGENKPQNRSNDLPGNSPVSRARTQHTEMWEPPHRYRHHCHDCYDDYCGWFSHCCWQDIDINLDAKTNIGGFKREYGGQMFKKSLLSGAVSVSNYFNPCIGLEVGYQFSENRYKDVITNDGEIVFGVSQNIGALSIDDPGTPVARHLFSLNKYELSGPFALVKTRFLVPVRDCFDLNVELLAGFNWTRATFLHAPYRYSTATNQIFNFDDFLKNEYRVYLRKYSLVPRINVNFGARLNRCVSMSLGVGYEANSKIKATGFYPTDVTHNGNDATPLVFKLQNHVTFNLRFTFST